MKAIQCPHGIKPKSKCRECKRIYKQSPQYREYQRNYMKNYHDKNKEREIEYRKQNKERLKMNTYAWRNKERETYNTYQRLYHKNNPLNPQIRRIENLGLNYPLVKQCEFCGSTDCLQRHHPSYDEGMEWFFVTCCKSCHWYADRSTIVEGRITIKRIG